MDWRKTVATALLALVVVFCMTGCPTKPPKTPAAPWGRDSTWTGATYTCSVATTVSKGRIRYVMDWQDAIDTSDVDYASGETAAVTHEWGTAGTYDVKAQAILSADPAKASDFSPTKVVKVIQNNPPVVDAVLFPYSTGVVDAQTFITIKGHDPDGDSLRALVNWPGRDTTTELTASPCSIEVSHVFTNVGTAEVIVRLQDWKGTRSLPETLYIPIGVAGSLKWKWQDAEGAGVITSALVANDGEDEVVMSYCEDDWKFYSIKVANGKEKRNATTFWPEYDFNGGPALCAATGHVIVGSDEGELYGLSLAGLARSWRWPNITSPNDTEPGIGVGAPAISGSFIYVGRENDSLYKFTDAVASVNLGPVYNLDTASVVDAPVVDMDGSVYIGTDSGYLVKLDSNLAPYWRLHLIPVGDVNGPIIGGDGTVYCGCDSSRLFAVNPDGTIKWTVALNGVGARPALGRSALFVGSYQGTVYSIDPATGSINWDTTLTDGTFGFVTTPIVAANGYLYIQDENDFLYCLNQADGAIIWVCDCNYFIQEEGKHRPRKLQLTDYAPNPSITSTGDIIVVVDEALFCLTGYTEGTLDASAAWPKWMRDLSNTGKMVR